jgi:hypothetical protein
MAGMSTDREIDRLYQLPLAEFTAARNTLAKSAGTDSGAIKALAKPSVPAWAVNQLYWRERKAYDKLVRASERVRAGHAQALKGRKVDLATLELQHGAAIKDAADRVRDLLTRTGDAATPMTMKAVVDTLRALPGGEPGRLAQALAPIGFGAFGALLKGAVTAKSLAEVVQFAPPKPVKPRPDEAAEAARRAREAAVKRLGELATEAKRIAAELKAARAAADASGREQARIDAQLQKAAAAASHDRAEVARLEREARTVDQERGRLKNET